MNHVGEVAPSIMNHVGEVGPSIMNHAHSDL